MPVAVIMVIVFPLISHFDVSFSIDCQEAAAAAAVPKLDLVSCAGHSRTVFHLPTP